MRPAVPRLLGAAVFGATLLGACRSPIDRPVSGVPAAALPEPGLPALPEARAAFFEGLADVDTPLQWLRARATGPGAPPRLVPLADVEAAVLRRFAQGAPGGALREAFAVGTSAYTPLPPRRMADLLANGEAERHAFGADTFRAVATEFESRAALRRTYAVEMLDQGEGPIRFDFRFALSLERWDLADGGVLMRYDPAPWDRTEHVTLFRGVAVIEPAGTGSVVTEMLVFGSDVRLPFFLRGKMRSVATRGFAARIARLWRFAGALPR